MSPTGLFTLGCAAPCFARETVPADSVPAAEALFRTRGWRKARSLWAGPEATWECPACAAARVPTLSGFRQEVRP